MPNTVHIGNYRPGFDKMLSKVTESKQATVERFLKDGYQHTLCLRVVGGDSPTVSSDGYLRWRLMGVYFLYKRKFPIMEFGKFLKNIKEIGCSTPVIVGKKFYDLASGYGMGTGVYIGNLSPEQLEVLCLSFRREPHQWSLTKDETFEHIIHRW